MKNGEIVYGNFCWIGHMEYRIMPFKAVFNKQPNFGNKKRFIQMDGGKEVELNVDLVATTSRNKDNNEENDDENDDDDSDEDDDDGEEEENEEDDDEDDDVEETEIVKQENF